jgi:hypothetical protein
MGWLFAVALGLHRRSRAAVLMALPPLAAGHALSILLVATSMLALGTIVDTAGLRILAGAALLLWAAYHWLYGHRHRVRVGMTAGFAGLALWSFLMASSHGAGLMLMPALLPLCAATPGVGSLLTATAAVGVHTLGAVAVTGTVALAVYEWLGLEVLRRSWINFDLVWSATLIATGLMLILTA